MCASAGCDAVFGLRDVEAPPDAKPCTDVGHDEDGDGIDDGCDPCPFDVANDGDDDRDGIALACDPDPTHANQVLLFAGFGPTTSQFVFQAANIANDAIHTTTDPMARNTYVTWTGNNAVDDVFVIARVHVRSTLATATFREVGIIFDTEDVGSNDRSGTYCVLGKYSTQVPSDAVKTYSRVVTSTNVTDMTLDVQPAPFTLDAFDGTIRAFYSRSAMPQLQCSFVNAASDATITGTRSPLPTPGRLSLYVDDSETDWDYLFVVTK